MGDVLVIGGGIVGAAVAAHCARVVTTPLIAHVMMTFSEEPLAMTVRASCGNVREPTVFYHQRRAVRLPCCGCDRGVRRRRTF